MKDSYGKREYKCKCGKLTYDYVWLSKLALHELSCFYCWKELNYKHLIKKEVPQTAAIRTPTKNR
jgi:hypothetical protein